VTLGACAIAGVTSIPAASGGGTGDTASFSGRWFAKDSPWNSPVPRNPALLPGSEGFIGAFLASGHGININSEIWTPAVLRAGKGLARCDVTGDGWRLEGLPLPPELAPAIGHFASRNDTDASLCIYSEESRAFYNLFGARLEPAGNGQKLRLGAFGIYSIDGSGWWDNSLGPWTGRASGASYCGGLVRRDELDVPDVWHALAMAWPKRLVRADGLKQAFVAPARTTDGAGRDPSTAVPMGARLQLDPALDDEGILALGVKPAALPMVRALQRFGAYVVDSTDDVMALYVESSRGRADAGSGALGPLPPALLRHARFVEPPPMPDLESRLTVAGVVPADAATGACILPPEAEDKPRPR
jgi:hypothetical protein